MFARLWWKEARQTWPVWTFLILVGLAIQGLVLWYARAGGEPSGLAVVADVVTLIYVFLIAAAIFAGERENDTLWILDALPVERLRLWAAKASFAFATALGLGGLLLLAALVLGGYTTQWRTVSGVTLLCGLVAMGWGLFWSSLLANAMAAAVLAMVSLSVSLLSLANLQVESGTIDAAPALLLVTALTTAASAWIFRRLGPPRWEPRRTRPAASATVSDGPGSNVLLQTPSSTGRLGRVWTYSVPRLLWQALRQVRSQSWMLVGLAIASGVGPYLLLWNTRNGGADGSLKVFGAAVLALLTGVLAFNSENRGRTQRFLLQHGARAGVVWAVKIATWWLVALGLWGIVLTPIWLMMPHTPAGSRPPFLETDRVVFYAIAGLTIVFAVGVVCGMSFRRGIMAGMIGLVVSLAIAIPLAGLLGARVLFPWHWPYLAAALLAVGWAWCGDWLHDRPGWRRWARLAAYAAAVPAVLVPAYIAARVWEVPRFSPLRQDVIFQRSRIVAPVPDEDNAAPLYRKAYQLLIAQGRPSAVNEVADWYSGFRSPDSVSFDPPPPRVTDWLDRIEPALALLREAARKPACRYLDLRTANTLEFADEPPAYDLATALAFSARSRLAKGDLEGAWTEVETLERMARQYPNTSGWQHRVLDPLAVGQALRWAVDPRQTPATLEKAARAWRDLPAEPSPADRIRAEAALFQNMLDLPGDELADLLVYGPGVVDRKKARVSPMNALAYDVQTTSWERARTRRVYDLLAAAQIRRFENNLHPFYSTGVGFPAERWRWMNSAVDPYRPFTFEDGDKRREFTPDDLNALYVTTPLLDYSYLGNGFNEIGRNQTARRAVWLVLLMRLYQARHDGKLPDRLDAILAREGSDEPGATAEDLDDLYSENTKRLGYIASNGQPLPPIDAVDSFAWRYSTNGNDSRLKPTQGYMLLYSVGPDGADDRAEATVGYDRRGSLAGDLVFPIKNDVKPPSSEAR